MNITVTRLLDAPIIGPDLHPSIGVNIQGPSLIRAPDWLPNRLGRYYLYFADHKGSYIRLAVADALEGPWRIHVPGSLQLARSQFLTEPPIASEAEIAHFDAIYRSRGVNISHGALLEITTPHIASPDVHIDPTGRRIVMYFHGLQDVGRQVSRVAVSTDGIDFVALPEEIGPTYMRIWPLQGMVYAIAMPGILSRSVDGFSNWETGPTLFNRNMRHATVLRRGNELLVFWTQVGEAPERIMLSRIALDADWTQWRDQDPIEVMRPERPWEGAEAPLLPSMRSSAYGLVNQLRDPAIYCEGEDIYLLYAVGGESGIGIARLDISPA